MDRRFFPLVSWFALPLLVGCAAPDDTSSDAVTNAADSGAVDATAAGPATSDPYAHGFTDADYPRVIEVAEDVYAYEQIHRTGGEVITTVSLIDRFKRGVDQGKKSSKVIQDCTICASCRKAVSDPSGPKERRNRIEWRETNPRELAKEPVFRRVDTSDHLVAIRGRHERTAKASASESTPSRCPRGGSSNEGQSEARLRACGWTPNNGGNRI